MQLPEYHCILLRNQQLACAWCAASLLVIEVSVCRSSNAGPFLCVVMLQPSAARWRPPHATTFPAAAAYPALHNLPTSAPDGSLISGGTGTNATNGASNVRNRQSHVGNGEEQSNGRRATALEKYRKKRKVCIIA